MPMVMKKTNKTQGQGLGQCSEVARAPSLYTSDCSSFLPLTGTPHTLLPVTFTHSVPLPGMLSSLCLVAPTHHCLESSYSCLRTLLRHHFLSSPPSPTPPPQAASGAQPLCFPSVLCQPQPWHLNLYTRLSVFLFSLPKALHSSIRVRTGSSITNEKHGFLFHLSQWYVASFLSHKWALMNVY